MRNEYKKLLEFFNFKYVEEDFSFDEVPRIEKYYELINDNGVIVFICSQSTLYIHSGLGRGFYSAYEEVYEDNQCYGYEIKITSELHLQNVLVGLLIQPPTNTLQNYKGVATHIFESKGE